MKFLLSITLVLITSVTFLYYLLQSQTFLPFDNIGDYNWLNISVLFVLSFLIVFSLIILLMYLFLFLSKRFSTGRVSRILMVKFSFILTSGVFIIFLLNFFNILSLAWGISIFVVVLIFLFII